MQQARRTWLPAASRGFVFIDRPALASSTSGIFNVAIEKANTYGITVSRDCTFETENERLTENIRHAELIIDVQKKVSELIQTRSPEKPG